MTPLDKPLSGLSAALIVRNEASRLGRLLPRLGFASEVVVVDGGSQDGTAQVARALGARVYVHPFDHFAAQRNRALELARGPWVLCLDADECPEPGLPGEIARRVLPGRHVAYRVPIRSRIFGRRMRLGGMQDDRPIRLVRKDGARWTGWVHEHLVVRGPVGQLHHGLEHVTLPDLEAFLKKMEQYTTAEAAQLLAGGARARRWHLLVQPALEVARRLLWKQGWCEGPRGWAFCLLSGLSRWVLWHKVLVGQRQQCRDGPLAHEGHHQDRPKHGHQPPCSALFPRQGSQAA